MEIIGVEEVMRLLGVGRRTATAILSSKGCPTLPRVKGGQYRVEKDAFISFVKGGCK